MKQLSGVLNLSKNLCRLHGIGMLVLFTVLLTIPLATAAQITSATIVGTISDSGGAVLTVTCSFTEPTSRVRSTRAMSLTRKIIPSRMPFLKPDVADTSTT